MTIGPDPMTRMLSMSVRRGTARTITVAAARSRSGSATGERLGSLPRPLA